MCEQEEIEEKIEEDDDDDDDEGGGSGGERESGLTWTIAVMAETVPVPTSVGASLSSAIEEMVQPCLLIWLHVISLVAHTPGQPRLDTRRRRAKRCVRPEMRTMRTIGIANALEQRRQQWAGLERRGARWGAACASRRRCEDGRGQHD